MEPCALTRQQVAQIEEIPAQLMWALCWSQGSGIPVLPCHPETKAPLVEGGKLSATTDPDQIIAWWREFPNALVGGRTDGLVVLDFDSYKPGHADDLATLGDLSPTRTFRTPGKGGIRGRHLVYRDPDGQCRSTKIGPNGTIDVRAGNSSDYIILPPSRSSEGVYKVADWRAPAVAPAWLVQLAGSSRANAQDHPDEGLPEPEAVQSGTRLGQIRSTGTDDPSVHTFRLIRNCRKAGLSPGAALTLTEADEITTERRAEGKRQQPHWWPREFWRCWHRAGLGLASNPDGPPATPTSSRKTETMQDDRKEPDEKLGKPNTATHLMAMARRDYEFGLMTGEAPYAVPRDGPNVARVFRGGRSSLRSELAYTFEQQFGRPPSQNALSEALQSLEGEARKGRKPIDLPMRTAWYNGELVLDLGDEAGRAVTVGPDGWKVVDRSPVLFLQTELTGELPEPQRGGKLSETLFPLLNLPRSDRALVTAILLSWLWPDIDHPVTYLHGEEGTAKTHMARILRSLADPSPVEVRRQPGRDEDWEVTIAGQQIVVLDNLSTMADWLSDALCTAVTGTGDVKRRMYSNQELSVIQVRRSFILTSVDASLVTRGDLVDRTVTFGLEPIAASRTREELEAEWEQVRPLALGALLDLASHVLARLPDVPSSAYSDFRMADFARIVAAFDQATRSRALPLYRKKRADAVAGALEIDVFAVTLKDLALRGGFDGSVGELFAQHVRPHLGRMTTHPGWPKSPAATGERLRRVSGLLRKSSVSVTLYRDKKGKRCQISAITESAGSDDANTP